MKIKLNTLLLGLFISVTLLMVSAIAFTQYQQQFEKRKAEQQQQIQRTSQDVEFLYHRLQGQPVAILNEYLARQTLDDHVQWVIISENGQTVSQASDERLIGKTITTLLPLQPQILKKAGIHAIKGTTQWVNIVHLHSDGGKQLLLHYDFSHSDALAKWEMAQSLSIELIGILLMCLAIFYLGQKQIAAPLSSLSRQLPLLAHNNDELAPSTSSINEINQIHAALVRFAAQIRQQTDELRTQTQHYQSTLRAIPDLLFELSASGTYLDVHARNQELIATQQTLIGKNIREVLPPKAAQTVENTIAETINSGQSSGQIIELEFESGPRYFELSSSRLPQRNGEISCLMLSRDITYRIKSQQTILNQIQLHELILRTSMDGFWLIDPQGQICEVNDAYLLSSGFSRAQVIGQSIARFDLMQSSDQIMQNLARLRAGKAIRFETQHQRANGQMWHVEVSAGFLDHEGGLFFAFLRDISESKHQEEQLRLWKRIFAQTTEGIILTDTQEQILLVNEAFTATTGYSEDELKGLRPNLLASGRHNHAFYQQMHHSLRSQDFWEGEIWNRRKNGEIYPEWLIINAIKNDEGQTTHYVGLLRDISLQKANEEQILRLANYDTLTQLPNRNLLRERASQALIQAQRHGHTLALMFLDLDHFKNINDTLGHSVGDELLIHIAQHLKHSLREEDTIARQGGDEFVLLLPDVDESGAITVAEKLLENITRPIQIAQHRLVVTPSIGIAIYPRDGQDFGTLSSHADAAMYKAKSEGRHCFRCYTPAMHSFTERRLKLEAALRTALARNELQLVFQPQIQLSDGRPCGAEALLRWHSGEFGVISPDEFIPLAEDSGLIIEIGAWVVEQAARQLKYWQQQGIPSLVMAVNVSALQFRQEQLAQQIEHCLSDIGIDPRHFELELTESVTMDDPSSMIAQMHQFHQLGIKLAIDDFGTGYSSLSYLKSLPIDKLKIDRSFVRDLLTDSDDAAIIQTIISMAKALNYHTIAEGVETQAQREALQALGCAQIQGYLIGKPMDGELFLAWYWHYLDSLNH
jgi:diguanylate cyclase (GGDEF)-like protein/PAS domain S-box-containing protein